MAAAKVFTDISQLITMQPAMAKGGRRPQLADYGVIPRAAMVVQNGRIQWLGPQKSLPAAFASAKSHSLKGCTVLPGLIDCHTHLVFAGDRSHEFELRQQGQTYQQITAAGGGILSTVKATRAASSGQLLARAQKRAQVHLRQGITTVEIKSGYGLDLKTEIKMLHVAQKLQSIRVVPTYLGPHACPADTSREEYFETILREVLPVMARRGLAKRADIFVEKGYYDLPQARRYLRRARELGLDVVAHVEQLSHMGSVALLKEPDLNLLSLDHLVHLEASDIKALGASTTTAVLLPASDFYLKLPYPPARALLDAGARVALATDFNPGSSPTQDIGFVGLLARLEMKMSQVEVITALTVSAAHALGLQADAGSLAVGKWADFCVTPAELPDLFYQVGNHPISATWVAGSQRA